MKRKSLIVKKKADRKISINDPKVKKFYNKFKSIILKNIKNSNFAVAVSGGSDSLCLAYFSKIYASEIKNKIYILIVDHKLRKGSQKEALEVKKILKKKYISSKVLVWKGKIPTSNIQKEARDLRYSLIANFCLKRKIKYLLVAHHLDDQIENFFIRLFRGSGLKGLSSMLEKTDYNGKLKIIRPFLNVKKIDLQYATLNYFKDYIKDPSNEDNKYLRVRVRKYRKKMESEGLDTSKIIKTVKNLTSANKALNFYKNKALNKHVSFISRHKCIINNYIFYEEAGEVVFKSFSDILSLISGTYYPPRSKKIINLINRLKLKTFSKSTLGGCVIEKNDGFISILKEQKIKKTFLQPAK